MGCIDNRGILAFSHAYMVGPPAGFLCAWIPALPRDHSTGRKAVWELVSVSIPGNRHGSRLQVESSWNMWAWKPRPSETVMPDLTSRIVRKAFGDVGVKPTLFSEVSPLHDQRQGRFGHDLFFSSVF